MASTVRARRGGESRLRASFPNRSIPATVRPMAVVVRTPTGYMVMVGSDGGPAGVPAPKEVVPVPHGSDFYTLPGRAPVGFDPGTEIRQQHARADDVDQKLRH